MSQQEDVDDQVTMHDLREALVVQAAQAARVKEVLREANEHLAWFRQLRSCEVWAREKLDGFFAWTAERLSALSFQRIVVLLLVVGIITGVITTADAGAIVQRWLTGGGT